MKTTVTVTFTAEVEDDEFETEEQAFEFCKAEVKKFPSFGLPVLCCLTVGPYQESVELP